MTIPGLRSPQIPKVEATEKVSLGVRVWGVSCNDAGFRASGLRLKASNAGPGERQGF